MRCSRHAACNAGKRRQGCVFVEDGAASLISDRRKFNLEQAAFMEAPLGERPKHFGSLKQYERHLKSQGRTMDYSNKEIAACVQDQGFRDNLRRQHVSRVVRDMLRTRGGANGS